MPWINRDRAHYAPKLHDELVAAGLHPEAVLSDGTWLNVLLPPGDDPAMFDRVLAAHDPTPPTPPVDPAAELDGALRDVRQRAAEAGSLADVRTAVVDLVDALLGEKRAGRVAARPR